MPVMARRGGEETLGKSGNDLFVPKQFQQVGDSKNPGQFPGIDTDFEGFLHLHKHFHHPEGINLQILNKSGFVLNFVRIGAGDGLQKTS